MEVRTDVCTLLVNVVASVAAYRALRSGHVAGCGGGGGGFELRFGSGVIFRDERGKNFRGKIVNCQVISFVDREQLKAKN